MSAARRRGRTRWLHFTTAFLPALVVMTVLGLAAAPGLAPLAVAAAGRHPLKLSAQSFSAASITPTPESFETRDGHRRTELVFQLRELRVRGLCLSNRVPTPLGPYVLRINAPSLTSERLTVALDSVDSLTLLDRQLNIGDLLAGPSPPLGHSDEPGILALRIGNTLADLSLTIRWLTGQRLRLHDATLASGLAKRECF